MSKRARLLHDSPWQGVFQVTGGGIQFLAEMLGTAGASRTVLDAGIPYSAASLAESLGSAPRQACSAATARALAMAGFQRARHLGTSHPFGFALTASLATDRIKRGTHRAHIALQTATHSFYNEYDEFSVADDRAAQEQEVAEAAWHLLLAALGLTKTQAINPQSVEAAPEWRALVEGRLDLVSTVDHDGALLFPGSFNPLHEGHRRMMEYAEARLSRRGAFELSIENPDKPLLDYFEIHARLKQFQHPVWLTRLPRFAEKARRFPAATFIVGVDTLIRIADPRYYAGVRERDRQLAEMLDQGTRFLVFGRLIADTFHELLSDPALAGPLAEACTGVDETEFRMDISSTEIRRTHTTLEPDTSQTDIPDSPTTNPGSE